MTQYQNPVMNVKLKITRFWNRVKVMATKYENVVIFSL